MNREETFRNLVRGLLRLGVFPSPSAINAIRGKIGKQNTLGTDHARWRREELLAAGFVKRKLPTRSGKRVRIHVGQYNRRYNHPNLTYCRACGRAKP